MIRRPRESAPFPYTTPFRSDPERPRRAGREPRGGFIRRSPARRRPERSKRISTAHRPSTVRRRGTLRDRKSTRLNSSHANISYAVFCLKKKTDQHPPFHFPH